MLLIKLVDGIECFVLQAFDLDEFREVFRIKKISGKYLMECSTVDEVINIS